ncbi:MAG TPA: 50S ribosomal protein L25 [Patescibacteria group bacterium]|nr:50S ribosomal protein L25 [Patescibacteria group bacterium]
MAYTLKAMKRATKGAKIRTQGQLPGIVYGAGGTAESIALSQGEFEKLYKQAGGSTLIDLELDGATAGKVLVQEVQYEPVKDGIIHVDLRRIDMNKELTAPVDLRFVGEAPVIKAQGGTMVTSLQSVEVKCLPKDLVDHIDVDLSKLNSYDDIIKIKDLHLPAGITIVSPHAEDLVVKAAPAMSEEEIKAMEEASNQPTDLSKIEVAGKKKEEEGEEGAAEAMADKGAAGKEEKPAAGGKAEGKKEEKK